MTSEVLIAPHPATEPCPTCAEVRAVAAHLPISTPVLRGRTGQRGRIITGPEPSVEGSPHQLRIGTDGHVLANQHGMIVVRIGWDDQRPSWTSPKGLIRVAADRAAEVTV